MLFVAVNPEKIEKKTIIRLKSVRTSSDTVIFAEQSASSELKLLVSGTAGKTLPGITVQSIDPSRLTWKCVLKERLKTNQHPVTRMNQVLVSYDLTQKTWYLSSKLAAGSFQLRHKCLQMVRGSKEMRGRAACKQRVLLLNMKLQQADACRYRPRAFRVKCSHQDSGLLR